MPSIIGIGGIFLRSTQPDHAALATWYKESLGLGTDWDFGKSFLNRDMLGNDANLIWSIFKDDTKYFGPSNQQYMINYIVDDLDGYVALLAERGVTILPDRDDSEYGKFAWIEDPNGFRIELWEPKKADPEAE
jgi:predicted enzyme related to lactoylglutathione lyase